MGAWLLEFSENNGTKIRVFALLRALAIGHGKRNIGSRPICAIGDSDSVLKRGPGRGSAVYNTSQIPQAQILFLRASKITCWNNQDGVIEMNILIKSI